MIGVIDVGGGMRGSFGAGVFDYCLDRNIHFDYAAGVSAGAANIASYQAGQFGRNYKFYTEFSLRKEYMGFANFFRTHSYVDLDYIYGELTKEDGEYPLDYDSMMGDPSEFVIVTTDAETGEPVYFSKHDMSRNSYGPISASSCVPVINRPYEVNGRLYYDGGISDPIPYEKAFSDGCDRLVIVLTRPKDADRTPGKDEPFAKLLAHTSPASAERLGARADLYNSQLEAIRELEQKGTVLIVAPDDISGMRTFKRDTDAIKSLYRKGLVAAKAIDGFVSR